MVSDYFKRINNERRSRLVPKINRIPKEQFDKLTLVDGMRWPDYNGNLCIVENGKWVKLDNESK